MDKDLKQTPHKKVEKKKNKAKVIIIKICILLIILFLTLFFLNDRGYIRFPWEQRVAILSGDIFPELGGAKDGHLPNMTPEEVLAQMQKVVDESRFAFKINAAPVMETGRSEANLKIENPKFNAYPMVVRIFLGEKEDMQKLIFDSGGILPDQHIKTAKLTKKLDTGKHKAIAFFYVYNPKTQEYLGKQAAEINITVKN